MEDEKELNFAKKATKNSHRKKKLGKFQVNSLKHVIKRNKMDMADDAPSSLDLMRRVWTVNVSSN